jgi:26S proteasome regulatory subunit N13
MYSELFDQLGAANGRLNRDAAAAVPEEPASLVSFKAGKMVLQKVEEPASSYMCTPDKTRGEVRLAWHRHALQWQWYNRRDKKVEDTWNVSDYPNSTFERVVLPDKTNESDRIYVMTRGSSTTEEEGKSEPEYFMYWMQDASDEKDDEIVATVNHYLALQDETDEMDMDAAVAANESDEGANQSQVDALSSILENLGMPQANTDSERAPTATLTLADLQGAMAGIQQQQTNAGSLSLADIVTPTAISELLEDEAVRGRLMELLPEEQRSEHMLEENLRSPQVQQTLRSLTATLLPDDVGGLSGLYSVLANFQLDPADGQAAVAAGNPIQAFLDALLKSVEKDQNQQEETKEE